MKGTTSSQLSKAKNYLGSFFGGQKTAVKYDTGGIQFDQLQESLKFFKELGHVVANFVSKLKLIVTHLEKKSEGLAKQASLFTLTKNDSHKLELLGLEQSQVEKLMKICEQSEEKVNFYRVCVKDYFLFHMEDLHADILAAQYRISERVDKQEQIKANIMNITDQTTLQDQWDTHVGIMSDLKKEMDLYRLQSHESLVQLLSSMEKRKAKHYNEVNFANRSSP